MEFNVGISNEKNIIGVQFLRICHLRPPVESRGLTEGLTLGLTEYQIIPCYV